MTYKQPATRGRCRNFGISENRVQELFFFLLHDRRPSRFPPVVDGYHGNTDRLLSKMHTTCDRRVAAAPHRGNGLFLCGFIEYVRWERRPAAVNHQFQQFKNSVHDITDPPLQVQAVSVCSVRSAFKTVCRADGNRHVAARPQGELVS